MSEGKKRRKSSLKIQREREENFIRLTDEVCRLLERKLQCEQLDVKDLKQATAALKDLRELIWSGKEEENGAMTIKIEGDVL